MIALLIKPESADWRASWLHGSLLWIQGKEREAQRTGADTRVFVARSLDEVDSLVAEMNERSER